MKIRPTTWHARYFRFVQDKLFDGGYENGTNLCHYLRVVMLWSTLAIVFCVSAVSLFCVLFVMLLLVIPFKWLGLFGIGIVWATIAAGAAIIYYGAGLLVKHAPKLFAEDSIVVCLYQRSKAAKRKICPLVNFE